ncbi:unnamed protein product [Hermetia illucens]|uniref:Uncharacterized protein n=1 Tax=Hermetia illucens TaxID=343691 RepID=A0A7R8ULP2_HERIL|nr:unnamed protein product [Hermetia illucens]
MGPADFLLFRFLSFSHKPIGGCKPVLGSFEKDTPYLIIHKLQSFQVKVITFVSVESSLASWRRCKGHGCRVLRCAGLHWIIDLLGLK